MNSLVTMEITNLVQYMHVTLKLLIKLSIELFMKETKGNCSRSTLSTKPMVAKEITGRNLGNWKKKHVTGDIIMLVDFFVQV